MSRHLDEVDNAYEIIMRAAVESEISFMSDSLIYSFWWYLDLWDFIKMIPENMNIQAARETIKNTIVEMCKRRCNLFKKHSSDDARAKYIQGERINAFVPEYIIDKQLLKLQ